MGSSPNVKLPSVGYQRGNMGPRAHSVFLIDDGDGSEKHVQNTVRKRVVPRGQRNLLVNARKLLYFSDRSLTA